MFSWIYSHINHLRRGASVCYFLFVFFLISGKQDSSALLYFGIINYKTSKRIFTTHFKKKKTKHILLKSHVTTDTNFSQTYENEKN